MTRHPCEYKIAFGFDIKELEAEVNLLMESGWLPIGSVAINSFNSVYQAMIREREELNDPPPP